MPTRDVCASARVVEFTDRLQQVDGFGAGALEPMPSPVQNADASPTPDELDDAEQSPVPLDGATPSPDILDGTMPVPADVETSLRTAWTWPL